METTLLSLIISQALAAVAGLMASFLKVKGKGGVTAWGVAVVVFQVTAVALFAYNQRLSSDVEHAAAQKAEVKEQAKDAWAGEVSSPVKGYVLTLVLAGGLNEAFMGGQANCTWTFLDNSHDGICLSVLSMRADEDGKGFSGHAEVYRQVRSQSDVEPYEEYCPKLDPAQVDAMADGLRLFYPGLAEIKMDDSDCAMHAARLAVKTSFAKSTAVIAGSVEAGEEEVFYNLDLPCAEFNLLPNVETLGEVAGINACQLLLNGPGQSLLLGFSGAVLTVAPSDSEHTYSLFSFQEKVVLNDPNVGEMLNKAFAETTSEVDRDDAMGKAAAIVDSEGLVSLVDLKKVLAGLRTAYIDQELAIEKDPSAKPEDGKIGVTLSPDLLADGMRGAEIVVWTLVTSMGKFF